MFIALLCFNFLFPFFFHSIWRPKRNFHPNGEMFPLSRLIRTTLTLQTTAQVCDELPLSGGRKSSHPWSSRSSDARFTQRFVLYTISHWIITAALQPCGCRGQMRKLRFRDENRKIEGNQFFKIITTKTKHNRHGWLPSQLISRSTRVEASCSIFSHGGMSAKNTPACLTILYPLSLLPVSLEKTWIFSTQLLPLLFFQTLRRGAILGFHPLCGKWGKPEGFLEGCYKFFSGSSIRKLSLATYLEHFCFFSFS